MNQQSRLGCLQTRALSEAQSFPNALRSGSFLAEHLKEPLPLNTPEERWPNGEVGVPVTPAPVTTRHRSGPPLPEAGEDPQLLAAGPPEAGPARDDPRPQDPGQPDWLLPQEENRRGMETRYGEEGVRSQLLD